MTIPLVAEIAELIPYIDNVITYDKKGAQRGIKGIFAMASKIRRENFTHVFCMNFAPRGAIIAWLARIPIRVGYKKQHGEFFLNRVAVPTRDGTRHESENQLDILSPLNIPKPTDKSLVLEPNRFSTAGLNIKLNERRLPLSDQLIICPFGNGKRQLAFPLLIALIKSLMPQHNIILIGGKGELADLAEVAQEANLSSHNVLGGVLTLSELACLMSRAKLLISVDTGPLHIAQATKCPTIGLYGHGNPTIWGPCNPDDIVIYKATNLPYWKENTSPTADYDEPTQEILVAVNERLKKAAHTRK